MEWNETFVVVCALVCIRAFYLFSLVMADLTQHVYASLQEPIFRSSEFGKDSVPIWDNTAIWMTLNKQKTRILFSCYFHMS